MRKRLALAAVSLSVGDGMAMYVHYMSFIVWANKFICKHDLPEPDEDDIATIISDEHMHITSNLDACLAPLNAPDEPTDVIDMNKSDLSTLSFANTELNAGSGLAILLNLGLNVPERVWEIQFMFKHWTYPKTDEN